MTPKMKLCQIAPHPLWPLSAPLFTKPTFYHLPYNNIFILSVQAFRAKHHHPARVLGLVVNITNILLTPSPPCYYCGVIPTAGGGGGQGAKQSLTNPSPGQDED